MSNPGYTSTIFSIIFFYLNFFTIAEFILSGRTQSDMTDSDSDNSIAPKHPKEVGERKTLRFSWMNLLNNLVMNIYFFI